MKKPSKSFILRAVQGFIIGAGAILPGVSGGVLAVIFGIYRPIMELLSHPKQTFKKNIAILLPVGIGWAAGFVLGAAGISALFSKHETAAVCLFIGLIIGSLPQLYREAGKEGRTWRSFLAGGLAFAVFLGGLMYMRIGNTAQIPQNVWGFLFCGAVFGLSFIVPGMTATAPLMSVGLFTPLITGITSFDWSVIIPWAAGMGAVMLLLAKLVNHLFKKHYSVMYHIVFGIVAASTLSVIPTSFGSTLETVICAAMAIAGAAAAFASTKVIMPTEE